MSKNILFEESDEKYCLFPISDDRIYKFYKDSISSFWTVDELNLSNDTNHWNDKLTDNERYFIKMVLAFFASSDGIVSENLVTRFSNEVQLAEAKAVYSVQNTMEAIHGECYSILIDSYIKDRDEKLECFQAIHKFPSIKQKCDWGLKWINDKESTFAKRLVAFAVVEGLFFSGAFCAIYWLKKRGLMPGLTFSNELISRDEALHTEYAIYLYNTYCDKIAQDEVFELFREAVEIEKEFICDALPCRLIGMNSELMQQYIEFVGDRLLSQLKYEKMYNTKNPFDFMEVISLCGKTNFFEKRVAEYSLVSGGDREKAFDFTSADF